jgi:hypothetical protein
MSLETTGIGIGIFNDNAVSCIRSCSYSCQLMNCTGTTNSCNHESSTASGDQITSARSMTREQANDDGRNAMEGVTEGTSLGESVTIPEGVTEIGDNSFEGCIELTSLEIPEGVTKIGSNAFKNCTELTSLHIPKTVTEIGRCAFENCSGLTTLQIPNGITTINGSTFAGCSGLTSLLIPDSVTEIRNCAFEGCTALTSLHVPDSATTLGKCAFKNCSGLTSLHIPKTVTKIGGNAFEGCTGLTSLHTKFGINSKGFQQTLSDADPDRYQATTDKAAPRAAHAQADPCDLSADDAAMGHKKSGPDLRCCDARCDGFNCGCHVM